MSVKSCSSGTSSVITGNIDVVMMMPSAAFLNLNSSRASAYAVSVPTISTRIVVVPATIRLLSSALANPLSGANASW
jgi:hypothetical protein